MGNYAKQCATTKNNAKSCETMRNPTKPQRTSMGTC